MEREAAEAVRNRLRTQVFEALQRDNQLELPKSMVDEQIQQLQYDLLQRMGRSDTSQMPPRDPFVEPAQRRVKLGLLIGELIRRENITVDRGRVLARLEEAASGYPNPDEVRAHVAAESGCDAPDRDFGHGRPGRGVGAGQGAR